MPSRRDHTCDQFSLPSPPDPESPHMKPVLRSLFVSLCCAALSCSQSSPVAPTVSENVAAPSAALGTGDLGAGDIETGEAESVGADGGSDTSLRRFRFVYGATVTGLEPDTEARIWLPVATTNSQQTVERTRVSVPGEYHDTMETQHGNHLIYFNAIANDEGAIPLEVEYEVQRKEVRMSAGDVTEEDRRVFLASNRLVPTDGSVSARILAEIWPTGDAADIARALYDAVGQHMRYDKPAGGQWGRGDALWACDSAHGNCTDFHSMFISLCRDHTVPAKFEMGFPIPTENGAGSVGGYHCWAMFSANEKWVPVDISEADKHPEMAEYYFGNLTSDRVTFTTGRDLELNPPQAAGPVNFLVYPYVEVDGQPHSEFEKRFRYEDLP